MNLSGAARQPIDESMRNSPRLPTIDVNSETLHVKSSESTAIHPGYFPPGVYTPKTLGPNSHTGLFLLDQAALPLPTWDLPYRLSKSCVVVGIHTRSSEQHNHHGNHVITCDLTRSGLAALD